MEFRLLGHLQVFDGQREIQIAQGRRRALLTFLLLHRNEVVPADRLIDELWGARPPPTAAKGLQVQISQLRKELVGGGGPNGTTLRTRGAGYVLEVAPEDLDVACFEAALTDADAAMTDGEPERAAAHLRGALGLWRGPPLGDVAYEEFAQPEIARLEELRLTALERRIDADLAVGSHDELAAELEALVREHPLRERLRGQLMLSLYRCGRTAEALEAYREGRAHSVADLGLEPGPDLRALEAGILAEDPELAAPPRLAWRGGRGRRGPPLLLVAGGALLVAAALAALVIDRGSAPAGRAAAGDDIAPNSAVALGLDGRRVGSALPLPGRPTDLAADGDRLVAVSVDSSALTVVDGRTRAIVRTVPLAMTPAAVAAAGGGVWVADGRRGMLVRLDEGYERVVARVTWRRTTPPAAPGLSRSDPTGLAVASDAAWVTDGSSRLLRASSDGRLTALAAPYPLDGVAAGAGAVWAFSTRRAAVVRVDPGARRLTDVIPIVARPSSEAAAPMAIAATDEAVWVLNGNTATVTRIDARTRGVVATIRLAVDRGPRDLDASAGAVWVANFDGSVTRIPVAGGRPKTIELGGSLTGVAAGARRVWLASTALDQQLPGGAG